MAIARETGAKLIKPLEGAIVRRFTAGAALGAGEVAAMMSDGFVGPAIGTSLAGAAAVGIVLPGLYGKTTFAAGDSVDVVVFGPVQCVTGATPGAVVFVSDTAGEPAEAAGTKSSVVGRAISATVVLVGPYQVAWA
jgi:hypothetical protein